MLPRSLSEGLGLARTDEAVRQSAHFNGGLDMALDVEDVGAKKPGKLPQQPEIKMIISARVGACSLY